MKCANCISPNFTLFRTNLLYSLFGNQCPTNLDSTRPQHRLTSTLLLWLNIATSSCKQAVTKINSPHVLSNSCPEALFSTPRTNSHRATGSYSNRLCLILPDTIGNSSSSLVTLGWYMSSVVWLNLVHVRYKNRHTLSPKFFYVFEKRYAVGRNVTK